ncbi:MAG: c-type cytochrome [Chitinophagaceae bacterium]
MYVLNRETGKSLFPVEERSVPVSYVPGEEAWPTQPFPLKPKPFARQVMTEDDLADFSPGAHDSLVKKFRSLRYDGLFTPPDLKGSLNLPGTRGGAEWGGAAHDPESAVLYVRSNDSPEVDSLQKVQGPGAKDQPASVQGKAFYTSYCLSCHGADRNGDELNYPSLIGLEKRMTREAVLNKIKQGDGKMPAFAGVVKGREEAIIAYLFQLKEKKYSREASDLAEIAKNKLSLKDTKDSLKNEDTAATYLNLTAYSHFRGPDGYSAIKPPWSTLNAIDLNTGEYVWQVPAGNHPELQKKGEPFTGSVGSPGPMVTAGGLVFLGGTRDKKFRAYNKDTGETVWEMTLPAAGSSTPCSYSVNGKQYIAISVGGDKKNAGGYIMAFALPH